LAFLGCIIPCIFSQVAFFASLLDSLNNKGTFFFELFELLVNLFQSLNRNGAGRARERQILENAAVMLSKL
jgi:hypothetical protein